MATDPQLTGYLVSALSHEMGAVQQYLAQASLSAMWELGEVGSRFRRDAEEELGHAQQLIERMLVLGTPSNGIQLPPIRPGRTLEEMLLLDRELELDAVRLYEKAAHYCARLRHDETHTLFADLLQEELTHLAELDQMLTEIHQGSSQVMSKTSASNTLPSAPRERPPALNRRFDCLSYAETRGLVDKLAQLFEREDYYPNMSFGTTYVNISIDSPGQELLAERGSRLISEMDAIAKAAAS